MAPPFAPLGAAAFGPVGAVAPASPSPVLEEFAKDMDGYIAGVGVPFEPGWRVAWDG